MENDGSNEDNDWIRDSLPLFSFPERESDRGETFASLRKEIKQQWKFSLLFNGIFLN